eukprot:jgi/Bigna1/144065/aug1.83_g18773
MDELPNCSRPSSSTKTPSTAGGTCKSDSDERLQHLISYDLDWQDFDEVERKYLEDLDKKLEKQMEDLEKNLKGSQDHACEAAANARQAAVSATREAAAYRSEFEKGKENEVIRREEETERMTQIQIARSGNVKAAARFIDQKLEKQGGGARIHRGGKQIKDIKKPDVLHAAESTDANNREYKIQITVGTPDVEDVASKPNVDSVGNVEEESSVENTELPSTHAKKDAESSAGEEAFQAALKNEESSPQEPAEAAKEAGRIGEDLHFIAENRISPPTAQEITRREVMKEGKGFDRERKRVEENNETKQGSLKFIENKSSGEAEQESLSRTERKHEEKESLGERKRIQPVVNDTGGSSGAISRMEIEAQRILRKKTVLQRKREKVAGADSEKDDGASDHQCQVCQVSLCSVM